MDLRKPVIVSALFDIDRPNWVNFKSSYHTYIHWSRQLMSIDCALVVFTEEKFFKPLFDIRKEYDTDMSQTKFIVQDKTELQLYKTHYHRIKDLMESKEFKKKVQFKDVPEMCQPWYNILMLSKLTWMREAYVQQYLEGDIFIWKDIAVYRDTDDEYNVKWPDVDKISFTKPTFYNHHNHISIYKNEDHILSQQRFIQGGCFIVPGYLLQPLNNAYLDIVDNYLGLGYIGSDEKYFDILIKEDIDKFLLIECGWREYFRYFKYGLRAS